MRTGADPSYTAPCGGPSSSGLLPVLAGESLGQVARRTPVSKGPRALGLVELPPGGVPRLIPITVLYDGQFYDAGAYKAAPVPMALETQTVYEAVKTGVPQGLFIVTGAIQVKDNWVGQGSWRPAGSEPKAKKTAVAAKPPEDDLDKPPVLRHADAEKPSSPSPVPSPPAASPPPVPATTPASAPAPSPAPPPSAPSHETDDDHPVLRRGKPEPRPEPEAETPVTAPAQTTSSKPGLPSGIAPAKALEVQMIPAISDASGPEARPYSYNLKPEEEQTLRKQMLALAANEVRARDQQLAAETIGPVSANPKPRPGKTAKLPQPNFDDVRFQVFDLSSSNEPVLVLSAKAKLPSGPGSTRAPLQYFVTVVARQTIYGDLHKAFSAITDTQHLDVLPHVELIDAVDGDGDGRGELLFRQTSEAGTAYVLYRVIGDQLWPLFQSTPQ